jgi:hypothetical protein
MWPALFQPQPQRQHLHSTVSTAATMSTLTQHCFNRSHNVNTYTALLQPQPQRQHLHSTVSTAATMSTLTQHCFNRSHNVNTYTALFQPLWQRALQLEHAMRTATVLPNRRHSTAMLPHSPYLVCITHLHESCHVHFVEGGQHRICVLCPLQSLSHTQPQPRHLHTPAGVITL